MTTQSEIAIIGGGPAGSTAATILAKRGFKVTLFEKEVFPRHHVGETLLPFCYHIFEELGVLEQMEENFSRKPGARFLNHDASISSNYCFQEVIKGEEYLSFHVERGLFDQILLNNAKKHQVEVVEGTFVKSVEIKEKEVDLIIQKKGERRKHKAQFLIDASGQSSFLGNKFKTKKKHKGLDRTAFWAHWKNVTFDTQLTEGNLQIIFLKQTKGWIWLIPFKNNRVSIGVVIENTFLKTQKVSYKNSLNWKSSLYLDQINETTYLNKILTTATLETPIYVNGDYSYDIEKKYDNRFALIGDASGFIDPIFSSGVFLSMNSAKLVAHNLSLEDTFNSLTTVYEKIEGAYNLVREMILNYYNPQIPNFYEMTGLFQQQDSAYALLHYLLAGDFFNRYETYSHFLDKLKNPDFFAKYKNLVYKRATLEKGHCNKVDSNLINH